MDQYLCHDEPEVRCHSCDVIGVDLPAFDRWRRSLNPNNDGMKQCLPADLASKLASGDLNYKTQSNLLAISFALSEIRSILPHSRIASKSTRRETYSCEKAISEWAPGAQNQDN